MTGGLGLEMRRQTTRSGGGGSSGGDGGGGGGGGVHVMVVGHKRGFTHTTNNDGTGLLRERERSCVYTIQIKLTLVW